MLFVLHLIKLEKCQIYLKRYEKGLGTVSEAQIAAGTAMAATVSSGG